MAIAYFPKPAFTIVTAFHHTFHQAIVFNSLKLQDMVKVVKGISTYRVKKKEMTEINLIIYRERSRGFPFTTVTNRSNLISFKDMGG